MIQVEKIDTNEVVVARYESITEAAAHNKDVTVAWLHENLHRRENWCGGYRWRHVEISKDDNDADSDSTSNGLVVAQQQKQQQQQQQQRPIKRYVRGSNVLEKINEHGQVVQTFPSVQEAANYQKVTIQTIYSWIRNFKRTTDGYFWKWRKSNEKGEGKGGVQFNHHHLYQSKDSSTLSNPTVYNQQQQQQQRYHCTNYTSTPHHHSSRSEGSITPSESGSQESPIDLDTNDIIDEKDKVSRRKSKIVEKVGPNGNVVATYSSVRDAAKQCNTTVGNIYHRILYADKPVLGYYWRYRDSTSEHKPSKYLPFGSIKRNQSSPESNVYNDDSYNATKNNTNSYKEYVDQLLPIPQRPIDKTITLLDDEASHQFSDAEANHHHHHHPHQFSDDDDDDDDASRQFSDAGNNNDDNRDCELERRNDYGRDTINASETLETSQPEHVSSHDRPRINSDASCDSTESLRRSQHTNDCAQGDKPDMQSEGGVTDYTPDNPVSSSTLAVGDSNNGGDDYEGDVEGDVVHDDDDNDADGDVDENGGEEHEGHSYDGDDYDDVGRGDDDDDDDDVDRDVGSENGLGGEGDMENETESNNNMYAQEGEENEVNMFGGEDEDGVDNEDADQNTANISCDAQIKLEADDDDDDDDDNLELTPLQGANHDDTNTDEDELEGESQCESMNTQSQEGDPEGTSADNQSGMSVDPEPTEDDSGEKQLTADHATSNGSDVQSPAVASKQTNNEPSAPAFSNKENNTQPSSSAALSEGSNHITHKRKRTGPKGKRKKVLKMTWFGQVLERYDSVQEASSANEGVQAHRLYTALKTGNTRTNIGGFHWKYDSEAPPNVNHQYSEYQRSSKLRKMVHGVQQPPKPGPQPGKRKKVLKIGLDGTIIARYDSVQEAVSKNEGVNLFRLYKILSKGKTTKVEGGFYWKNEIQPDGKRRVRNYYSNTVPRPPITMSNSNAPILPLGQKSYFGSFVRNSSATNSIMPQSQKQPAQQHMGTTTNNNTNDELTTTPPPNLQLVRVQSVTHPHPPNQTCTENDGIISVPIFQNAVLGRGNNSGALSFTLGPIQQSHKVDLGIPFHAAVSSTALKVREIYSTCMVVEQEWCIGLPIGLARLSSSNDNNAVKQIQEIDGEATVSIGDFLVFDFIRPNPTQEPEFVFQLQRLQ